MHSTLIPERPLLISPTLAATIGLEEAVMLHVLSELIATRRLGEGSGGSRDARWVELDESGLQAALPFWAPIDIRRVQSSLRELGLLSVEARNTSASSGVLRFTINDGDGGAQTDAEASPRQGLPVYSQPPTNNQGAGGSGASSGGAATLIPPNWLPEETWLKQCLQHNIPEDFVRAAVPEFVQYWRDRAQARFSWGNAFYKHVLKLWREEQTRRGAFEQASEMSASWRPSDAALQILGNAGVNAHFVEDAIPEFVLYWEERGASNSGPWNTKFIEHVRRQWARYSAMQGFDDTPRPIPANWSPSADFYETLQLAEIDAEFANARVAEFVLYWRDSQQAKASWNTAFLQFVKAEWARQLQQARVGSRGAGSAAIGVQGAKNGAEGRRGAGAGTDGVAQRLQQLDDRSWAS
ncbi:MAG: DnaT-like ssDNA-binding domain-containing protein [Gammaproteobacteria bacterium]|jgi:hypothetical protein|nr:DnaT-like ssDNA-binding domain-containing protein [Gammaproteobacteria bacterium]